jgi:hypothetical protein
MFVGAKVGSTDPIGFGRLRTSSFMRLIFRDLVVDLV